MPTLIDACVQLREGLMRARVANQTRLEISAFQERHREWKKRSEARRNVLSKVKVIGPDILRREDFTRADAKIRELAEEAKQLMKNGAGVQSLANDNLWARLIGASDTANQSILDAAKIAWRKFIDDLGRVESPPVLESRVIKTPANDLLIARYREGHARLQIITRDLPSSSATKDEVVKIVAALREIHGQVQSTAPESVRRFLKAVEMGGAALELITPEVIAWIRENDDLHRFVVTLKAASSWR